MAKKYSPVLLTREMLAAGGEMSMYGRKSFPRSGCIVFAPVRQVPVRPGVEAWLWMPVDSTDDMDALYVELHPDKDDEQDVQSCRYRNEVYAASDLWAKALQAALVDRYGATLAAAGSFEEYQDNLFYVHGASVHGSDIVPISAGELPAVQAGRIGCSFTHCVPDEFSSTDSVVLRTVNWLRRQRQWRREVPLHSLLLATARKVKSADHEKLKERKVGLRAAAQRCPELDTRLNWRRGCMIGLNCRTCAQQAVSEVYVTQDSIVLLRDARTRRRELQQHRSVDTSSEISTTLEELRLFWWSVVFCGRTIGELERRVQAKAGKSWPSLALKLVSMAYLSLANEHLRAIRESRAGTGCVKGKSNGKTNEGQKGT